MPTNLKHIAFIMDGNRRWAVEKGLPKMEGHTRGVENFKKIVEYASELGIPYITFWALSTDNLKKRSPAEIAHLFKLLGDIKNYLEDFAKHRARIQYIGDLSKLPKWLQKILAEIERKTKNNKRTTVTLAINYGGRDEIVQLAKKIAEGKLKSSQINESSVSKLIDSGKLPPAELMIRTGGHSRTSGYLPWQIGYSELYFTDKHWPEFKKADLKKAISWYEAQQRNLGG